MSAITNGSLACAVFFLFTLAVANSTMGQDGKPADAQRLGEDLLRAAENRDWKQARQLLEQGADPNVTAFTPQKPIPDFDHRAKAALERPTALSQAAEQGDCEAVKLLLGFKASLNIRTPSDEGPLMAAAAAGQTETARLLLEAGADWSERRLDGHNALDVACFSGKRDTICLFEDAANVPLWDRTIAQDPFAPGAETAQPQVVPGTVGAFPLRHLLWVSPHELLVLREGTRHFALLDLKTESETLLPELSRRWVADKQFEPDMLTLSPDGKWMLGFGGTEEKPTWIASEVRGDGWQEWSRDTRTPKSRLVVERNPLIAWIDGRRWVELNHTPKGFVARVRTRGVDTVDELPLSVPKYLSDFPSVLFTFPLPNEGRMGGEVGVSANGHQRDQHFVTWLIRVVPNTDGWRVEQREVVWQQADHPGYFHRCVLSPDGQRLAWNNYFTKTEARAIIVSDAEGKNPRIVYEHLYSSSDDQAGRTEAPWSRALEWTPQGDCLAFWRGEYGENGLCLLPVPIK